MYVNVQVLNRSAGMVVDHQDTQRLKTTFSLLLLLLVN